MSQSISQCPVLYKKLEYRNGTYIGELKSTRIYNPNLHARGDTHIINNNVSINDPAKLTANNQIRQGFGMFLSDSSEFLIGNWSNNQIVNEYTYIGRYLRAFGSIHNSLLEGFNMITLIGGSQKQRSSFMHNIHDSFLQKLIDRVYVMQRDITMYGNFRYGKPYGHIVVIMQNFIIVYRTVANNQSQSHSQQSHQIVQQCLLTSQNLQVTLDEYFPNISHRQLPIFLQSILKCRIFSAKQGTVGVKSEYKVSMHKYQNNCMLYGFRQLYTQAQYGIMMIDHQIMTIGIHERGILNGIGTMFTTCNEGRQHQEKQQRIQMPTRHKQHIRQLLQIENGVIQSSSSNTKQILKYNRSGCILNGVFQNGQLHGVGICYNISTNQYNFGNFITPTQVQILKVGKGWPLSIIIDYQLEFHLRSVKFISEFVNIDVLTFNLMEALSTNSGGKAWTKNTHISYRQQFQDKASLSQKKRRFTTQNTTSNPDSKQPAKKSGLSPVNKHRAQYRYSDNNYYNNVLSNKPDEKMESIGGSKYFTVNRSSEHKYSAYVGIDTVADIDCIEAGEQNNRGRNWTNVSDGNRRSPNLGSIVTKQEGGYIESKHKEQQQQQWRLNRKPLYFKQSSVSNERSGNRKARVTTMYARQS